MGGEVDEKKLARVRALLAKAEATEFPDEAETLSAKAQALMVRHSLREAIADHARGRASAAEARRIWIDNPYVAAKVALVQAVAQANRCRTVWIKDLGCVVTVGAESDLDLVDLLATSLLVQASRAMLSQDADTMFGDSRVRSLSDSPSWSPTLPALASGSMPPVRRSPKNSLRDVRLLPVLVARNRAADEAFNRLFPRTVASPLTGYDSLGSAPGAPQRTQRCSTSETRLRADRRARVRDRWYSAPPRGYAEQ